AVDQVILGGLSMGGQIVFEFYRQFPSRVRALILADTQPQAETEQGRIGRYEMAQRVVDKGMENLANEILPKLVAARTFDERPDVVEKVRQMILGTNPEGAAAALRGRAERRDYIPLMREINVPTLVVVGSEDAYTPVSDAHLMHQGIAGSQLVVFEGIGHMPNMERPGEFNAALMPFVRSVIASWRM
ncbi:MAG TPA: alpha/beta hydrolase, partial [Ktedonobacterales bacterium]|nr:alpha/beta hydrolase [Ktedonobacterales bacterium]